MNSDVWTKLVEDMKAAAGEPTVIVGRERVMPIAPARRLLAELTQDAVEAGTYGEPAPQGDRRHDLAITHQPHDGSVPYLFRAQCGCGWTGGFNAWKWVALGIQAHLTDAELMNGRGRLAEP